MAADSSLFLFDSDATDNLLGEIGDLAVVVGKLYRAGETRGDCETDEGAVEVSEILDEAESWDDEDVARECVREGGFDDVEERRVEVGAEFCDHRINRVRSLCAAVRTLTAYEAV